MKKEFYLVGGTAIALQIGHRQSIDFDLFKKSAVRREKIAQSLRDHGYDFQLLYSNSESFHVIVKGVKITFFQFPFDIPAKNSFEGIRLPDLLQLAAMKAYALGRRAKWKDYLDLYFIIRDHFPLQSVIERAVTLFPGLFSEKLFRQQLCYFEDVDYTEEVSFLPGHEVDEATIKAFLIDIATKEL
ncbi:nucleotidyl transferase AbiEii/AbiGii toxin family protein [Runella sp.]|uniref:nucleotidyl transferase AbiEii/AbiGii toxin family protein n=1 Tax=Runella sp. TaxID=1960881 RepID=UPI003015ADE7